MEPIIDCSEAETAFAAVAVVVDKMCSAAGGHGGGGGGLTLEQGQNDTNRGALLQTSYGTNSSELWQKLSGDISHDGGTFQHALSESDLKGWVESEKNCK